MTLAQQIDRYLKSKGSPLAGYGRRFVAAGRRNGVDPRLLVAIAGQETSFATYKPSQAIRNAWGWGPHIKFPSWGAGIDEIARGLRSGYLDQGLRTIPQIGKKWAPIGAENDPTGLNNNWAKGVSRFYGELGGQVEVGPQAGPFGQGGGAAGSSPGSSPNYRQVGLLALTSLAQTGKFDFVSFARNLGAARQEAAQYGGEVTPPKGQGGRPYPTTGSSTVNAILAAAHSQIGKPYVWGGESPSEGGFDCSGLLDWAFQQAGIDLPGRLTTYSAMQLGRSVKGKELRPGDFIISNGGKHMVMYVGGGKVIAAPHRGAVVQYQPVSRFKGDIVDVRRVL